MFQVERLQFDREATWAWVDEVAIAAGPIEGLMCYLLHVCTDLKLKLKPISLCSDPNCGPCHTRRSEDL